MGKEKFRRDLNNVFDDMAGAPSPTLGDRVHSSLVETPKPRNYFWVAGVAAILIAALIVGVTLIANPLHRRSSPAGVTTPAPGATPSLTVPTVAFAGPCRLPIMWGNVQSQSPHGGFMTFPGGKFSADPAAQMTPTGQNWLTYNARTQRWLPVLRRFATPDGTKYVSFGLGTGTLMHINDVSTGRGYNLDNDGVNWRPVGMDDTAVYAMGQESIGLWKLPLRVGPPVQIANGGWWDLISAGAAWGFATQTVPAGAPTVLKRLDLASGTTKDFATFIEPVRFVGVDPNGLPIMAAISGRTVFTLSASGHQTAIPVIFEMQKAPDYGYSPYAVVADGYGLWITGADGLYLYRKGSTGKVSDFVAWPEGRGCI